jgi:hypothetical protein
MRLSLALIAAAAALTGGAAQAAGVEIRDAVARVTVIPENRSDVRVEVTQPNARLPIQVRNQGGRVVVDGDLERRIRNCRGAGANTRVEVRGVGDVGWNEIPQIVIRTPRNADVSAGGAVFGTVGRSSTLSLRNAGCGDWVVGNVDGALRLSQAGSGDTQVGSVGSLAVRVAGSGDVATQDVRGGLDVNIAGSGSVATRSISGPLSVSIAGSGDVTIGGGRATTMGVSVAGSGDVEFRGSADTLKARIMGSGDVKCREVKGSVDKTIMGSGSIIIG